MVHDVASGELVGSDDIEVVALPSGQRPESALSAPGAVVGRVAAGPLAAREVVTSQRLVGSGILAGQPGDHVAMSVPVLDAVGIGVRPGSRVDLFATGTGRIAASDVVVLAVRAGRDASALGSSTPDRLTLALSPPAASEVARSMSALEAGQIFVVAVRAGPDRSR